MLLQEFTTVLTAAPKQFCHLADVTQTIMLLQEFTFTLTTYQEFFKLFVIFGSFKRK
jgi:hypothetical protein